jgi:hypothetical protein
VRLKLRFCVYSLIGSRRDDDREAFAVPATIVPRQTLYEL